MSDTTTVQKTFWLNTLRSIRPSHILDQLNQTIIYWLVPISIFVLWWLASNNGWMPVQILPTPQATWQTFLELSNNDLWWQLGISLERLVAGLSLGIIGGLLLGALLGYSRVAEQYISATFYALAIIPTLAWLPLLMVVLGIENALKIFLIFKATLIPIAIHTQTGVRDIQPKLQEMAKVLKFSKQALFFKLILPATLPYFFTGLRLAIAAGWTTLIAVELLASSEGIGYLMVTGRQLFQLDIVFVTIILIALVSIFLDVLLQFLERKFVFWPHAALAAHAVEKKAHKKFFQPWVIPVLLFSLWVIVSVLHWVSGELLPSPLAVGQALWLGIADSSLSTAMYHSLYRALLGLFIGGTIGVVTGILLGLFRPLQDIFAPTLNTLRLIAIFAWIPLITAWFGLGDLSKIVFISLATFFPMFIASWKGTANIPQQLDEASDVLRLNPLQRLQLLILPSIAPSIFAGFRLALLYSWLASFGAEYLMGSGIGIGSYMMAAQQHFEIDRVIAATILVAALGIILAWLGKTTENHATAWRKNEG
ncbi:MAG: ABC transporter permease [Acinetobacter sp.]|uniref:ABC transporter permease n=1 Tax=Acinetobacter sp. TaxID=472 RepID=UPI0025900793|nr:ABC transporter permease [Acinetobacter sp.]MCE1270665.1 ABC transporter permease [Acinetobacter sp.]